MNKVVRRVCNSEEFGLCKNSVPCNKTKALSIGVLVVLIGLSAVAWGASL